MSILLKRTPIPLIDYRFRRLALKFHPLRNPTDLATNSSRFSEICEAYDVLSNCKFISSCNFAPAERKALFDKYGEYGLKEGIPNAKGCKIKQDCNDTVEIVGGYRFGGNSYEIFDKFFGSSNPFVDKLEDDARD
jgi:DnaJ homolog subfamily B member 13